MRMASPNLHQRATAVTNTSRLGENNNEERHLVKNEPHVPGATRERLLAGWRDALRRTME
ncbi:MAG: hypothetical protein WAY93_05885 [Atopobiaceae bacterium]|jgi:hypothetical protein